MTVRGPHFGFPGICDLGNGELLIFALDASGHGGYGYAIRSWRTTNGNDATPTWTQDADVILTTNYRDARLGEANAMVTSSGTIVVTTWRTGHAYCCRSTDRGASWSDPILMGGGDGVDAFGPAGQSRCSGPAVEVVPGTLVAALYGTYTAPATGPSTSTTTADPDEPSSSIRVVSSTDDGLSWGRSTSVVDGHPGGLAYYESNLCLLDDGDLYCMHRTSANRRSYSLSSDRGASWSRPVDLPIVRATARPSTIQCTDPARTMLHIYRRSDAPHMAMYVASTDRGRTWGKPGVFTPGAGTVTPGPGGWFIYAQMVETAPGDVAVAYAVESNPKAVDTIDGAGYLFFDRISHTGA